VSNHDFIEAYNCQAIVVQYPLYSSLVCNSEPVLNESLTKGHEAVFSLSISQVAKLTKNIGRLHFLN